MGVNVNKMGKCEGRKKARLPRTSSFVEVKEATAQTKKKQVTEVLAYQTEGF